MARLHATETQRTRENELFHNLASASTRTNVARAKVKDAEKAVETANEDARRAIEAEAEARGALAEHYKAL
jgi:hypothetical protein